jgi:hypothetical protein
MEVYIHSNSPYVGRPKIKEWLIKKHSEYWAAALGVRQSKLFIEDPLEKISKDLLASHRKQCRLVTGLLTAHCTLRWQLHVMGLLDNAICRKLYKKRNPPNTFFVKALL